MSRLNKFRVTRQAIFQRAHAIKTWCRDNAPHHTFGDCLKTAWLEAREGKAQYWGLPQETQNELNGLDWSIRNNERNAHCRREQAEAENHMLKARKAAILSAPVSLPLAA
jgi:hypothetical protein